MDIGIASIQRNRSKWIVEWLAFHLLVGFNKFYIYAHKCTDDSAIILLKLAQKYDIKVHVMDSEPQPQLVAYQHAYNSYAGSLDWMAFIDGDEFLHPTRQTSMAGALSTLDRSSASALAVYWKCYGSNGHLDDPDGLIVERYPRHSQFDFLPNRHVKSIVRGRQEIKATGAHVFSTRNGTVDELERKIDRGWMQDFEPSYNELRINHYAIQSYEFFKTTKQNMGAADGDPRLVRPDSWFFEHDRNECDDGRSYGFLVPLKLKVQELTAVIAGH